MEHRPINTHYLNRRALVGGVIASTAAFALPVASHQLSDYEGMSIPDLYQTIRESNDEQAATSALTEVFSRSGLAVYDDDVTTMLVPLQHAPSPLSFTESQVVTMVQELRGDSWRVAGDFDSLGPEVSEAGEAVPAVSDLYAGYANGVPSPGGEFVRELMQRIPEGSGEIPASLLPAPTAAMSLMSGEILGSMQEQIQEAIPPLPGVPAIPSLPGLPELPPFENLYDLPPLPELDNQVCGNIKTFVNAVIQRVLSVLDSARTATTIPILSQIAAGVTGVIQFGLNVVTKAVEIVIAPVMGVLKSIAAAVAIASNLIGTITPWTVAIRAEPNRTRLGVGAFETISGDVLINAGGADDVAWPPIVTGCAEALGLSVPSRTSAGAPVEVTVHNPANLVLVELAEEERILDDSGNLTILYVTTNEPEDVALRGQEMTGVVYLNASVDRDDLRQFSERLIDLLLAELPTIIANVLRDLTQSLVNELREKILELTRVRSSALMFVTYHQLDEEEEQEVEPEDTHCLVGNFEVVNTAEIVTTMSGLSGEPSLTVASVNGSWSWRFNTNGTFILSWDGVAASFQSGGTSTFSGEAAGSYSVDGEMVTLLFESSTIMNHYSGPEGALSLPVPSEQLIPFFDQMSFICGDPTILSTWWGAVLQLARMDD